MNRGPRSLFCSAVTEDEIISGIFNDPDPNSHCLCYVREMEGVHEHLSDKIAGRYVDVCSSDTGAAVIDAEAQALLRDLKSEKIPSHLNSANMRSYSLTWLPHQGGIQPENIGHAQYLDRFCGHVFEDLKGLIDRAHAARSTGPSATKQLSDEILHHASFCVSKCESFHGREDILARISSYLTSNRSKPLVIYGASGSGKTSVMAKAATSVKVWFGDSCVCVIRFLGTSPNSSTIREALTSVCLQVYSICGLPPPDFDKMDATQVTQFFRDQLPGCVSLLPPHSGKNLCIFLDSVDQLSPSDGAHTMNWLPKSLPPNFHLVVSMLPEEHNCLATLRSVLPFSECYVHVDAMPVSTGIEILNSWLAATGRAITSGQQEVVSRAFALCPQPLFMKLVFKQAHQWRSYTPVEDIVLPVSTAAALTQFFEHLEEQHGRVLVRHTFGYLAASRNGLTEVEIEDVLSLDDEVLDDVYQYWDPPVKGIVRIPPLLWKRISYDIGDYIVKQQADGMTVLQWYHRQFTETAENRYLGNEAEQMCHSLLATYFEGTWSKGKKKSITLSHRQLTLEDADRQVASQPLKFSREVYNLRKLSELAFHLSHSGQHEKAKRLALCNFEWLINKLQATSYVSLVQDHSLALSLTSDEELSLITETLSLSASNLQVDPTALAGQLIGRLILLKDDAEFQHVSKLLEQSAHWGHSSENCQLIPKNSCLINPGGPLKMTLSGHTQLIQKVCVSYKQSLAASASKGKDSAVINIWDISSLDCIQNLHTLKIPGSSIPQLVASDDLIFGSCNNAMKVWNTRTGDEVGTFISPAEITSLGITSDGQLAVLATECGRLFLWDRHSQKSSDHVTSHRTPIGVLALTGNDDFVVSGTQDGEIGIFRIACGELIDVHSLQMHSEAITTLCTFTHDSQSIGLTGSEDSTVKSVSIEKGRVLHSFTGHTKAVKCLQVIKLLESDEPLAISGSMDKTIRVWGLVAGTCLHTLTGHTNAIWCLATLKCGSQIVSGSKDDYLRVWELSTGKCLHKLEGHSSWISCVATFGEDIVVSGSNDKTLKLWKLKESKLPQPERHFTQPECITATGDNLAISGAPSDIKVWRTRDGHCLHTWSTPASILATDGHSLLVSGAKNGRIDLWSLSTFEKLKSLEGHTDTVTSLQVIDNASMLLSGSSDGSVKKWNLSSSLLVSTFVGHSAGIKCLAVSNDASIATSGSFDCSIRVWEVDSGKCLIVLSGHTKVVWCVAITRSKETVVSGSDDQTLRIWNLKTGLCLHTIRYADNVKCLAVTADDREVIAGAHCGSDQLKSWNIATGECLNVYRGHTHAVMCMLLASSDKYLITGSRDGTIKVWQEATATLLASFDLQSQVKYLVITNATEERVTVAATTKSGPVSILELKFPSSKPHDSSGLGGL